MVNTTLYAHPTEDGAVLTDVPDEAYIHTYIDCGKNVKLFKAIAAINDATDYGQVFVSTSGWTLSPIKYDIPKYESLQRFIEVCADSLGYTLSQNPRSSFLRKVLPMIRKLSTMTEKEIMQYAEQELPL